MALASGRRRLRAELAGQRTVLSDVFRTAPFHPGPVHHRGGTAEVVLQGVGPGLFPGESLEIDIIVRDNASLVVSAQGATKVYASPHGTAAQAATTLRVGRGASLCWLPGELIPFRDASYAVQTEVHLEEGARFALLDILTPGRTAMGEFHAYRRLDLRLRVASRGKPILVERALLDPKREPLTLIGRQGDVPCIGTLILAGYELPAALATATMTSGWPATETASLAWYVPWQDCRRAARRIARSPCRRRHGKRQEDPSVNFPP